LFICYATNVSCYGGNDGNISGTASGGTQPYTYLWSTGATTANINGLAAGTYYITVSDAHSCYTSSVKTIIQPNDIVLNANTVPASCPDANDGSIDLSVSGGTSPYGYLWSNMATIEDIDSLAPGTYSVTVTDAHSCIKSGSYSVGQTSPVCAVIYVQNIIVSDTICYNATQTIYVAGLPPSYQTTFYVLSGGYVTMIAGQNIIYYPGTRVYPGGYMRGYIAPNGPWCDEKAPSIVTVPEGETEIYPATEKSFFTIYPNPTTGGFSLELKGIDEAAELKVEMYGMHSEHLFSADVKGQRKYDFSLTGKPVGVYFIRVITGKYAGTVKIIKE
jgi:hypothetical protein